MWVHGHQNWLGFTWNAEALASRLAKCLNDTALRDMQDLNLRDVATKILIKPAFTHEKCCNAKRCKGKSNEMRFYTPPSTDVGGNS